IFLSVYVSLVDRLGHAMSAMYSGPRSAGVVRGRRLASAMAVLWALDNGCCDRFCADRVVRGLAAGSHWGGEQHRCSVGWGAASLVCGGPGGWRGGLAAADQRGRAESGPR